MEVNRDIRTSDTSRTYRTLRPVFVAGLALSLILYFVPLYTPTGDVLKTWSATGGVERKLSSFDLCRLLVDTGNVQWGAFYMALSGVEVALLVLALQRPRRWVFIAGSCEQLYTLITYLLRPTSNDLPQPLVSVFLSYASWAMCFTGFWVKPPVKAGTEPSALDPTTQP